jgi:hypothetical protein
MIVTLKMLKMGGIIRLSIEMITLNAEAEGSRDQKDDKNQGD